MARLHSVITLSEYRRLTGKKRLVVRGEAVLEAKLDGYLAIVYGGEVYTGSGRRAPPWMKHALSDAGIDIEAVGPRIAFLEIYGRCASPGGFHRNDKRCYRAALVDAFVPRAYAGGVEEAVFLARSLGLEERIGLGETMGAEAPATRVIVLSGAPEPWELRSMLTMFHGYEGYVLKLYSEKGHVLPPDYGAKLRGLLEVKIKHRPI